MTVEGGAEAGGAVVAVHLEALAGWLINQGVQMKGALSATRIGLGQSNLTYLLTDEARGRWVARRPPLGNLLASAHDVTREHKILTALAGTDVRTPGVVGLASDLAICDVPVLVVDYVEGLVLDRAEVIEPLSHEQRHRTGLELADALARLHDVDLRAVGLSDLASHSPYAGRQLRRWSRQWEASRTRDLPTLDRLSRWLEAHAPERSELTVVHGDMHLRNVILDPATCAVRAVLDWELCTLGDPLADLGSTLAYWPERSDRLTGISDASARPGFATRQEIAESYAERSGRDLATITFWHALGLWKIAIICEGIRRRAIDEPSNAAEGGPPEASIVEQIVDSALELIR